MNTQLLQARMKEFFANVKPEYLVQEFEKMGYTFVDCDVNWDKPKMYNLINRTCQPESRSLLDKLLGKRKSDKIEKNLTSVYPGSFFLS